MIRRAYMLQHTVLLGVIKMMSDCTILSRLQADEMYVKLTRKDSSYRSFPNFNGNLTRRSERMGLVKHSS